MAHLSILKFPDPRLRRPAKTVTVFDSALEKLADDMVETMYFSEGIGLAAVQVNIPKRLITVDVSEDQDTPMVMVNPVILTQSGEAISKEGCLSVPEYFESVSRAENITISYQDVAGNAHELAADGLLSICIQHEIDHLDGKLFVDYLSDLKRDKALRLMKKLSRAKKAQAEPA